MSYHNMRGYMTPAARVDSAHFDRWLTTAVEQDDVADRNQQLINWAQGDSARASHPREEHLLPLMVAAGAADTKGEKIFSDEVMMSTISAFRFR
jgi:aromatic ring-opening dioxygenase catalytic subunit (LigB family)